MQITMVLWVILAVIFALFLVLFQYYYYKNKRRGKLFVLLSFLRFIAVFSVLLLLINPKFNKTTYFKEKANLIVLVDNSASIKNLNGAENTVLVLDKILQDSKLNEKFHLKNYHFASKLAAAEKAPLFTEKNTNIGKALHSIADIYNNTNTAIVLLTDGNQTIGNAYEYFNNSAKIPVYPVVVGDTTKYDDLKITQINKNRYAFLKNEYPLEIYVSYEGEKNVSAQLVISENGKNSYRKNLSFSKTDNSKIIQTTIKANAIGVKKITVSISSLKEEKNTSNNKKTVAIEVIDEKTNVAIVSSIAHPDLGALKKAIQSNEQRTVSLIKPNKNTKLWEDIDLFIMYQPNTSFTDVFKYSTAAHKNTLLITGTKTDWNFVNTMQATYNFDDNYPIQEVFPSLNESFSKFDISDFNMDNFPPLQSNVSQLVPGTLNNVLLKTTIRGVGIETPLLVISENKNKKQAFLFGEGIWKWRMQSYRNHQNFTNFDTFLGKLLLYLSATKQKSRFLVDYKRVYLGSNTAVIKASVFDETFVFDTDKTVLLTVKSKDGKLSKEMPMLLRKLNYEADLSNFLAGDYTFTATVKNTNNKKHGSFSILEYDIEKQFLASNYQKLNRLANTTNGKLFFPDSIAQLREYLLKDDRFKPVQKSKENIVPLIDFKALLALIVAAFALEWFIRKYNGLT